MHTNNHRCYTYNMPQYFPFDLKDPVKYAQHTQDTSISSVSFAGTSTLYTSMYTLYTHVQRTQFQFFEQIYVRMTNRELYIYSVVCVCTGCWWNTLVMCLCGRTLRHIASFVRYYGLRCGKVIYRIHVVTAAAPPKRVNDRRCWMRLLWDAGYMCRVCVCVICTMFTCI